MLFKLAKVITAVAVIQVLAGFALLLYAFDHRYHAAPAPATLIQDGSSATPVTPEPA